METSEKTRLRRATIIGLSVSGISVWLRRRSAARIVLMAAHSVTSLQKRGPVEEDVDSPVVLFDGWVPRTHLMGATYTFAHLLISEGT